MRTTSSSHREEIERRLEEERERVMSLEEQLRRQEEQPVSAPSRDPTTLPMQMPREPV